MSDDGKVPSQKDIRRMQRRLRHPKTERAKRALREALKKKKRT